MTEPPARKPRPRRTFSAFGDVRKMPSEYEIVTHKQNWTLRTNRAAAFEQNPSSAPTAKVQGALGAHADTGSDAALSPGSVALLARLLTPSRYLCHGFQQVEA